MNEPIIGLLLQKKNKINLVCKFTILGISRSIRSYECLSTFIELVRLKYVGPFQKWKL